MSRIVRLLLITIGAFVFASPLFAQNAVVLGSVYDAKGAPMPGVIVLLENKSISVIRNAVTGADGSYSIPEVKPGDGYVITATTKDGEELDKRSGITVSVGDEREILPALKQTPPTPAGTEPTTGTTAAAAAQSSSGGGSKVPNDKGTSISGVITGDQLRTLPLYNRNFLALGLLSPNSHDTEAGSALSGASFSIAGQRPSSNNFLLDGAENVASNSNQAIPFQVNDAIKEFRVTSSTANAEFGRGAGGVVSVATQYGTNNFHGSLFGYFANDALNLDNPLSLYKGTGFDKASAYAGATGAPALALTPNNSVAPVSYNQYVATALANGFASTTPASAIPSGACNASNANQKFDPAAVLAKCGDAFRQPFDSKQFGANLGGPISRDKKIFGFGSYEGTRINNPNAVFERVPSTFDRTAAGNTSDYMIAQKLLGLLPTANVIAVPGVLEFYKGTAPNYTNVHNALVRIDYNKSEGLQFNLRYAGQLLNQLHDDTLPEGGAYPGNGAIRKAQNQSGVLSITRSYKKLINDLKFGVTQFRFTESPQDSSFNATTLGLKNSQLQTVLLSGLDPRYSGAVKGTSGAFGGWYDSFWSTNGAGTPVAAAIMQPSLDGLFPFARIGAPLDAPSLHRDTAWIISDGLNWSLGRHSFKFGGDFRYLQNRVTDGGFSRGYIASGDIGEFAADSETCNTGQLNGIPCTTGFSRPSFDYALNQQPNFNGLFNSVNFSGYAQDSWKVTKTISINLGGRYEFFGVPKEANDQIWNYDPVANGLVQQGGTQVFDPYGYSCNSAISTTFLDSIPRDRSGGQPLQWQCKNSTAGNIIAPDYNDFAGRAGFAWDVHGKGRTVVRGGVGIFYDQSPVSYMARLMENRPTLYNANDPRYIYGQSFLSGSYDPTGGPNPCPQCAFGNSTVNAIAPTGSNNSEFTANHQSAASPFGLAARDNQHSRTPYARQANFTIQQQINNNVAIEAGYVGAGGHRLPIIYNSGYNNEWFCTNTRVPVTAPGAPAGSTAPVCDSFTYFPIETQANIGSSLYHSGMARLRIAQFHGLRLNATYTYSRSTDNASSANPSLVPTPLFTQAFGLQQFGLGNPFGFAVGGGTVLGRSNITGVGGIATVDTFTSSLTTTGAGQIYVSRYNLPQDPNNFLKDDMGRSDFDTTHRVVVDYNYDLPLFRNSEHWGNWSVSSIVSIQSGQPFTIFSGPLFGEITQRVNASGVSLTGNPNAMIAGTFTLPGLVQVPNRSGPGTINCNYAKDTTPLFQGTVGSPCLGNTFRNQFTGPAYASMDFAIQKAFKVFGEKELNLRAEAFNLLNRANFYNPISVYSLDGTQTSNGAPVVNPDFGQVKSAHAPLQLQFSARFTF